MTYLPLQYIEPLFRPPSEANSLILQVTNGCSWNHCAFCEMYTAPQKRFSIKSPVDIEKDIDKAAQIWPDSRRIFLADGDAMVLSTRRLLGILEMINQNFDSVSRISAYCLPRNIRYKSLTELSELKSAGLKLVYVGAESGDNELLNIINKGESFSSTTTSLNKLRDAGIKTSVMILNGLGGATYSKQHAIHSAQLVNETQPDYLATLVISFPKGEARFRKHFPSPFVPLDQTGLFKEMETFIQHTELDSTVFRSDHASNYLVLKGVLGKDKSALLERIALALNSPLSIQLRKEWQRGL